MVARAALVKAGIHSGLFALAFLLVAAVNAHAQTPAAPAVATQQPKPVTGFVSSYEILRTVRAAGFDPMGPPLREGTSYVLRATDFRGILMRVVLDARTGVIRDVTRIVSGAPGPYGMTASPYGPPAYASLPDESSPYGAPAYGAPAAPAQITGAPTPRAPTTPAMTRPAAAAPFPPLPRPRPAALASQKTEKPGNVEEPTAPAHAADLHPQTGVSANTAGVNGAAPPVVPGKVPPPLPFND
jgi:hypothetical protein